MKKNGSNRKNKIIIIPFIFFFFFFFDFYTKRFIFQENREFEKFAKHIGTWTWIIPDRTEMNNRRA